MSGDGEPRVGVLALQGASEPHIAMLASIGVTASEVRRREDLAGLTHLIIPGGESTTIRHLIDLFGLADEIASRHRAGELALFGVCAGAVLLGQDDGVRPRRLALLDARLTRNAYGRQVDSFSREIDVLGRPFRCVFIRAPKFASVGPKARVLARDGDEPILVEGDGILATTFHPELSGDPSVHRRFLAMSPAPTGAR
jgi:5'-phosphate synthase pdxT subunit